MKLKLSLYLTTYAKKKAHGKGAGKIRGERVEELCWVSSLSTWSQPASQPASQLLQVGLCNKYIGQAGRLLGFFCTCFLKLVKTDPNWPFMMPKSQRETKKATTVKK